MTASRPQFFGNARRRLFGLYFPPTGTPRRAGVVLCPAGPQDYRQTYWATRTLAGLLAAQGLHVLRFDYYGTGDSGGSDEDGSLAGWTDDVAVAAEELKDVAGIRRVAVVGLRLGAALAARATAAGLPATDLVLWDPVVSGSAYLEQLSAAHAWQLHETVYPESPARLPGELLGFVVPPPMRAALGALDLRREPLGTPGRTLVVHAGERADCAALASRLADEGRASRHVVVDDPTLARAEDWGVGTLLAHEGPRAIAAFLRADGAAA